MKIERSGSPPVTHTRPEEEQPLQISSQRTTRQHPLSLDSQPPEPVPHEKPARPPLDAWLGSDLQKDHNRELPTPPSQSQRISTWLRLQMTALRQTAESVFTARAKDPASLPTTQASQDVEQPNTNSTTPPNPESPTQVTQTSDVAKKQD